MPTPPKELYREISLTRGQVALVDADDYGRLTQWKWNAAFRNNTYYAQRSSPQGTIYLHREVLALPTEDKCHVDHKNRNTLDNRRCNLRKATRSQNQANTKARSASGYKGVYWTSGRWQAQIGINGKLKSLGSFSTPEAAHEAYKAAALIYHGEFSRF